MREEKNRYGQVKSESPHYWLDNVGYHSSYVLKRAYQECGCYRGDDCNCDDSWVNK